MLILTPAIHCHTYCPNPLLPLWDVWFKPMSFALVMFVFQIQWKQLSFKILSKFLVNFSIFYCFPSFCKFFQNFILLNKFNSLIWINRLEEFLLFLVQIWFHFHVCKFSVLWIICISWVVVIFQSWFSNQQLHLIFFLQFQ